MKSENRQKIGLKIQSECTSLTEFSLDSGASDSVRLPQALQKQAVNPSVEALRATCFAERSCVVCKAGVCRPWQTRKPAKSNAFRPPGLPMLPKISEGPAADGLAVAVLAESASNGLPLIKDVEVCENVVSVK